MKKIKLLTILLLIISLCGMSFAYDKDFRVEVHTNDLPLEGYFTQDFTLTDGGTLYFDVLSKDNKLNINIPESYYLNNTDNYELKINWSVDDVTFASDTTLEAEILLTNSLNDNNYSIGVIVNVIKDIQRVFDIKSTSSNIFYNNNTFYKNISILHDFPSEDKIIINVQGNPGEQFALNGCEDDWFLACENSTFFLNGDGNYQLSVPFRMEYTPIGVYNETFYLNSTERTIKLKAVFNVLQPRFELNRGVIEGCEDYYNLPFAAQMNCTQELLLYEAEGIMALNQYFSKVNTENICSHFVKTEYIVGDSVSKEVLDTNIELSNDNSELRTENNGLRSSLDSCNTEKSNLVTEIETLKLDNTKEVIELKNDKTKSLLTQEQEFNLSKEEQKKNILFWMKLICFLIFLFSLIALGVKFVWDSMTNSVFEWNIYTISLVVIGILFFFLWLGVFVWG